MGRSRTVPVEEQVEQEMVNDTTEPRKVRVYAGVDDDFILEIPPGARLTFGYFNPASPGFAQQDGGYGSRRPSDVARATALRVYADSTDKRQIACFLGVRGFRDESIKMTKIVQKVTIESKLVDDGEGSVEYGKKQLRELTAAPEAEF